VKPAKYVRFGDRLVAVSPRTNPTVKEHVKSGAHKVSAGASKAYHRVTRGTWFDKHGKTLALSAVAAAAIGGTAYFLYEYFNPGTLNSTLCTTLDNQLQAVITQIGQYNLQAYKAGGVYSSAAQAALVVLQSQQSSLTAQIAANCASIPDPGQTADKTLATIGYYFAKAVGDLITIGEIFIVVGASVITLRYLYKNVYSKKNGPGNAPESLDDTFVDADFNPAVMGNIIAQAQGVAEAAGGISSPSDVADVLRSMVTNDPIAAQNVSQSIGDYFTGLAEATEDADLAAAYTDMATLFYDSAAGDTAALDDVIDVLDGL